MTAATIYIINDWVPFPASEYGGLIVVLARSEGEAVALCRANDRREGEFAKHIPTAVAEAERVAVETDEPSRIIAEFRT